MRLPDHKNFNGIMNHKPFRVFEKDPNLENAAECIAAFAEANEGYYPGANDFHSDIYKIIYEGLVSTTRENETLRERVEELEKTLEA